MKRLFTIVVIALTGCSEPQQTVSFVAGQFLPATIVEVNSDKVFIAHFRQLNISDGMSNFEKIDAKTANDLRKNASDLAGKYKEIASNKNILESNKKMYESFKKTAEKNAIFLHGVDIRVGHDPLPVLLRTSDCFYTAKANSTTLGVISLSPDKKVCNEIKSDVVGNPVEVKTKQLENKITGEKINTITAERIINISGWN